jgi:AraC-like DNA-binding protein
LQIQATGLCAGTMMSRILRNARARERPASGLEASVAQFSEHHACLEEFKALKKWKQEYARCQRVRFSWARDEYVVKIYCHSRKSERARWLFSIGRLIEIPNFLRGARIIRRRFAATMLDRSGCRDRLISSLSLLRKSPPSSAETQLARPLGHDRALSTMIERYFRLCNDVAEDLDMLGQKAAAQLLADLVGLLLGTSREQKDLIGQRGLSAARLNLMKADVLNNLDKRDLTIESVARARALSGRPAQRLFACSGTTFSEFVLEQRLLFARRLLLHKSGRDRKVSYIAYTVGFNDLSYFHWSFRKRFGVTPFDMGAEFGRRQWVPTAGIGIAVTALECHREVQKRQSLARLIRQRAPERLASVV